MILNHGYHGHANKYINDIWYFRTTFDMKPSHHCLSSFSIFALPTIVFCEAPCILARTLNCSNLFKSYSIFKINSYMTTPMMVT